MKIDLTLQEWEALAAWIGVRWNSGFWARRIYGRVGVHPDWDRDFGAHELRWWAPQKR